MSELGQVRDREGLKALLGQFHRRAIERIDIFPQGAASVRLRDAVFAIEATHGDLRCPVPVIQDLDETWGLVKGLRHTGWAIDTIPLRHQRRSPWVVFYPPDGPLQWLGAEPGFTVAYLDWLAARARDSTVATMIHVFHRQYPNSIPNFKEWRIGLGVLLRKEAPRLRRWRERSRFSRALDPNGHEEFARVWLTEELPKPAFLERAGLTGDLSAAAFLQDAMRILSIRLGSKLSRSPIPVPRLRRALDFLTATEDPGRLRFAALAPIVAENLILPFAQKMPDPEIRIVLQEFLLATIGDPRLHLGRWQGINAQVRQIFLRWLADASLKAFFNIIEMTAPPYHWEYRRRFWSAYFNKGVVSEAWVAFGPLAAEIARRDETLANARFALLDAWHEPRHSILLMKLGGLTILEASHNGLCLGWHANNPSAPPLYEEQYQRWRYSQNVYPKDIKITHARSEGGVWQQKMAAWIQSQTGIGLRWTDYMPGGVA